jgi:prophage maintenance system killer protein
MLGYILVAPNKRRPLIHFFIFLQLQNNEIDINTKEEIAKMKKDIQGAAMNEAATQLESALRQVKMGH